MGYDYEVWYNRVKPNGKLEWDEWQLFARYEDVQSAKEAVAKELGLDIQITDIYCYRIKSILRPEEGRYEVQYTYASCKCWMTFNICETLVEAVEAITNALVEDANLNRTGEYCYRINKVK